MKISKEIIDDLIPLYATNECSAETRKLVEEYLQQNPERAEEIKRILQTPLPGTLPSPASLDEMRALREARRRLSRQQWLMGVAIFFSLAPLAFFHENGRTWWLLRDAPGSALVYAILAVVFWVIYANERRHPRSV